MKVLLAPFNVASQCSITVRALRDLGVDARGLARRFSVIQDYEHLETVEWAGKPGPVARLIRSLRWRFRLLRAMAWADVIHWNFGGVTWKGGLDLWCAARMRKPRIVEFWGSDLRDARIASRDNPYIARMFAENPDLGGNESKQTQRMFRRHGFECLIPGCELADYLDPGLFPTHHSTRARLFVDDFTPRFPEAAQPRPILAHAPSHKLRKGTEAVLRAVELLSRSHSFDFKLIHDMPRAEALKVVAECDLFLDQFTIGAEGMASYEAMALGKPVVCYIKPAWLHRYPADLPIVTASQDDLPSILAPLLADGQRRHDLGRLSRRYVEKYHDVRVVVPDLVKLYGQLIQHG